MRNGRFFTFAEKKLTLDLPALTSIIKNVARGNPAWHAN
jgi:hypothetical protein